MPLNGGYEDVTSQHQLDIGPLPETRHEIGQAVVLEHLSRADPRRWLSSLSGILSFFSNLNYIFVILPAFFNFS